MDRNSSTMPGAGKESAGSGRAGGQGRPGFRLYRTAARCTNCAAGCGSAVKRGWPNERRGAGQGWEENLVIQHAIADAQLGVDIFGVGGVFLQLAADVGHHMRYALRAGNTICRRCGKTCEESTQARCGGDGGALPLRKGSVPVLPVYPLVKGRLRPMGPKSAPLFGYERLSGAQTKGP